MKMLLGGCALFGRLIRYKSPLEKLNSTFSQNLLDQLPHVFYAFSDNALRHNQSIHLILSKANFTIKRFLLKTLTYPLNEISIFVAIFNKQSQCLPIMRAGSVSQYNLF